MGGDCEHSFMKRNVLRAYVTLCHGQPAYDVVTIEAGEVHFGWFVRWWLWAKCGVSGKSGKCVIWWKLVRNGCYGGINGSGGGVIGGGGVHGGGGGGVHGSGGGGGGRR